MTVMSFISKMLLQELVMLIQLVVLLIVSIVLRLVIFLSVNAKIMPLLFSITHKNVSPSH